jgi:hypothetical protein
LNLALTADGMSVLSFRKPSFPIFIWFFIVATLGNIVSIRSALLDTLAKQREEIAKVQAELRRERKENAKRKLRRLNSDAECPCCRVSHVCCHNLIC